MRDSNAILQSRPDAVLQAQAGVIRDWLLDVAAFTPDLGEALSALCERLVSAGVPVARVTTAVQLLNASSQGVGREWRIGEKTIERVYPYGPQTDRSYEHSPHAEAHRTGEWVILRPPETAATRFGVMPELKAGGYTHYICVPLPFSNGRQRNGVTFATRDPAGFTDAHIKFFRTIIPALRTVMELRASERILDEILQTYVGNDPHERILAGDIHRGSVTRIKSAILFSDLRGFTLLSMTLPEEDIADLLNRYFDCVVPEVERRGGEVLKFIGDGVLAIFQDNEDDGRAACNKAMAAAVASLERIATANGTGALPAPLICGIALHYGDAAYGNVGSGERLDFTVIGRDVNFANRITRMNGQLREPILMSEAFSSLVKAGTTELGRFELKGVPGMHPLYSPA
jgi:adenylate cyclase